MAEPGHSPEAKCPAVNAHADSSTHARSPVLLARAKVAVAQHKAAVEREFAPFVSDPFNLEPHQSGDLLWPAVRHMSWPRSSRTAR
jgi:hypothetical protein